MKPLTVISVATLFLFPMGYVHAANDEGEMFTKADSVEDNASFVGDEEDAMIGDEEVTASAHYADDRDLDYGVDLSVDESDLKGAATDEDLR